MAVSALVMAKAPRPGSVKTRLEPLLGPQGCAALQAVLISRAAQWAEAVAPGRAYVACGPDGSAVEEVAVHVPGGVALFADGCGDLGDRLAAATARVLREHSEPLLVVGTDMAVLTREHAREAEAALRGDADVVFGPALDGGYWIVGLRGAVPELFELGSEWGGPRVLQRSLALATGAGLSTELLGIERDLDDPADARALLARGELPDEVAGALRAGAGAA